MSYTTKEVQDEARSLCYRLEDLGTMARFTDDERSDEWVGDAIAALQAVARIAEIDEL